MAFLDFIIQNLSFLFVIVVCAWGAASISELRVNRYLFRATSLLNQLIVSRNIHDLKTLPECIIVEGRYQGRKVMGRFDIVSSSFLRYRIQVNLVVRPVIPQNTLQDSPLYFNNVTKTIVWPCSLVTQPSYDDIRSTLKTLTMEAEAMEQENS